MLFFFPVMLNPLTLTLPSCRCTMRTLSRFSSQLAFRLVSTVSRVLVLRGNSSKNRVALENTSGHLIRLNQRSRGNKTFLLQRG